MRMKLRYRKIVRLLKLGFNQREISELLTTRSNFSDSLSTVEKDVRQIKKLYEAKTMFHLGVLIERDSMPKTFFDKEELNKKLSEFARDFSRENNLDFLKSLNYLTKWVKKNT